MAGNTTENELEERAKQIDVALKKALTRPPADQPGKGKCFG